MGNETKYQHDAAACETFAQLVEELPDATDSVMEAAVLSLVLICGLRRADFIALDEKPGWFYVVVDGKRIPYERSKWAVRLRRVRNNPGNNLFDLLAP